MPGQLTFIDYLAGLPAPASPEGTYFVNGSNAYKRTATGWFQLDVVLGKPKFGYRNLKTGYGLMQPDYVGAYWTVPAIDEQNTIDAAYRSGAMEPIDHYLSVDLSTFKWQWQRSKRREPDGTVSIASAPGSGTVRLKKIPGRKATWIYSVDILAPDGRLFACTELGKWCGMMFFGPVSVAAKLVQTTFTAELLDTQRKIRDADSGKDFGRDLSLDKTPPELLARKLIAVKRINFRRPLEPVEMKRLLELNGERNLHGRFADDPLLDLSLDHLYVELICRYLAFGMIAEDVWGNGPQEWEQVREGMWAKGAYHVQPARPNRVSKRGIRFVVIRNQASNGPVVPGVFSTEEKAMSAADRVVFELPFLLRHCDGVREDFSGIKREILAAAEELVRRCAAQPKDRKAA